MAPGGRDAAVVIAQMASAGWRCVSVQLPELLDAIRTSSLGAAILTAEALALVDPSELRAALADQPQWSDCPFILLSSHGYVHQTSRRSIEAFGNVTVLERPLHPSTLVTAVATALRTRARQRKTEAYIQQREEAEAQVRSLAATLEARVLARTIELTDALDERRTADARLRESEERYRLTIDLSPQSPWIATPDFEITSFGKLALNPAAGAPPRDFGGSRWRTFVHPDDVGLLEQAARDAAATCRPFDCTFRLLGPDQRYAWHRSRANPKLDDSGKTERWYGTVENIDDQRRSVERFQQLQSELIHVSRVSAMGTMASTLAHELNQPLTAVTNYLRASRRQLAALDATGTEQIDATLGEADRGVMRAGEIVRRLREMVMLKNVSRVVEDAASVVREACDLALIDVASLGIRVEIELGRARPSILADRVQIQQVLINLLRNSVEAMRQDEHRSIWVSMQVVDRFCEITVRDTGIGIPSAIAARLFTPFNSAKDDGMGIGLSISRTIVEAHGGQISGRNDPAGGAIFVVRLPVQ